MPDPCPHILVDAPWDGGCEHTGWVEACVPEDRAREMLTEFCWDEDGHEARPVGPAKRVWLRLISPAVDIEDQRWESCDAAAQGALEFFEFDATDTVRVRVPMSEEAPDA